MKVHIIVSFSSGKNIKFHRVVMLETLPPIGTKINFGVVYFDVSHIEIDIQTSDEVTYKMYGHIYEHLHLPDVMDVISVDNMDKLRTKFEQSGFHYIGISDDKIIEYWSNIRK